MTARISAEDAATRLWAIFDAAGADGITKGDALTLTGLTEGQWHNGLEFLKDFLQEQNEQPIAILPGHRYALPQYLDDSTEYLVLTMRGLRSRLVRTGHGTTAHVSKFDVVEGRLLNKTMDRLVEDLNDAIALLVGGEA